MTEAEKPDRRLNAYRDDLADRRLEGSVEVAKFVDAEPAYVSASVVELRAAPSDDAGLDTEVLHGHPLDVFETKDGWCWVQAKSDGYVGYAKEADVTFGSFAATHMVLAPRTFQYVTSDLAKPKVGDLSIGSLVRVEGNAETRGTRYSVLSDGTSVISNHLIELNNWQDDPVSVAETLLHTPYLWGGTSGFGIDCTGLVQIAHLLCGNTVLRDSDMQAKTMGTVLDGDPSKLQRGDLVFWKGHVGMMADEKNLIHANGNTMNVAVEPLADAIVRIDYLYGQPTVMRRP